ncbi:MAG: type I restriction enzyme HsdR N-terminal domain-containing protein [Flavobacteriales bacterium]|nr:type I restriction enzyme HsdR N-terminal domain-containing protein [Flavobacteriales bacterium]
MGGVAAFRLPRAPLKFEHREKGIWVFNFLRKKWVRARPEEVVRLTLVHYMVTEKRYPAGLTALEHSLSRSGKVFRADVVVYQKQGKPWLLAECKAPDVPLDDNAASQALHYASLLGVCFVALCNGITCTFLELAHPDVGWQPGLPDFPIDSSSHAEEGPNFS